MNRPPSILRLDEQFNATMDELETTRDHYFITGRAGTGKSTLLRLWKRSSSKKMIVLAPTGSAALQVGGQTIHSFFMFPPRVMQGGDFRKLRNSRLIRSLDVIIIDEISMVRADMLDNIDRALRINRESPEPFGGVQMVLFGDLFQLPPIVSDPVEKEYLEQQYESPYFFSAKVWQQSGDLIGIELTKIYRQEEQYFLRLLEEIRNNDADPHTLESINERYQPGPELPPHTITICARRYLANAINLKRLNELPGTTQIFLATVTGNFSRSASPAPPELMLRIGAQVMFVRNDPLKQYVNGSLGEVTSIDSDHIEVQLTGSADTTIQVRKETWENIRYTLDSDNKITSEVTGTFEQYPLNLAWAITIHKSQGMTFDRVAIDLGGGAFDFGQTYVALSRCTSLQGIHLLRPLRQEDIQTDERIVQFYRKMF